MKPGVSPAAAFATAWLALWTVPARADAAVQHRIDVGGQARLYSLDRHNAEGADGPLPIIIFLPGIGTHLTERIPLRYDLPFSTLPDLGPALIAEPQGANRTWDSVPGSIDTWRRPSGLDGQFVDDTGFIRLMIGELVQREHGDPHRVYVAGVSAGGYMAVRVACELADVVTAVADVIATARDSQLSACGRGRPIPILLLASTTDPIDPYGGARGDEVTGLASAVDTVQVFVKRDGCTQRGEEPLAHLDFDVPSTVSLTRYSGCAEGSEVMFYRVDGSGHSVPSTAPPEPGSWESNGARNRDIDAAAVIWSFFSAHR